MKKITMIIITVVLGFSSQLTSQSSSNSGKCVKGDCKNGQGTMIFPNSGEKYVGEFKNGKRHGQGTYTFPIHAEYVGEWKEDKKHGQGTFTYHDRMKYVGGWKDDKCHGYGTLYNPTGSIYPPGSIYQQGYYENDKYVGK